MKGIQLRGQQTTRPWVKYGWWPVFVNTVLLEHSHVHSFTYYLRLLPHCRDRDEESSRRANGPQCLQHLLSGPSRKCLPTPDPIQIGGDEITEGFLVEVATNFYSISINSCFSQNSQRGCLDRQVWEKRGSKYCHQPLLTNISNAIVEATKWWLKGPGVIANLL